jgi:hypothetical protein
MGAGSIPPLIPRSRQSLLGSKTSSRDSSTVLRLLVHSSPLWPNVPSKEYFLYDVIMYQQIGLEITEWLHRVV